MDVSLHDGVICGNINNKLAKLNVNVKREMGSCQSNLEMSCFYFESPDIGLESGDFHPFRSLICGLAPGR